MRAQPKRMMLTVFALVLSLGVIYHAFAIADQKKCPPPELLSQDYLRGSMQGRSGISLDLNGDRHQDLIVGAPYAHHRDSSSGALLVYPGGSGGLQKQASIVVPGTGNFGWSLAALGDPDGDGKAYFAAGAVTGNGRNIPLSGTVTIYKGGKNLRKVAVLEGENAMDKFGFSMASGDLNGDGYSDLIIGAPMYSPSPSLYQQGAVYVYFGPAYNPADAVKISATSTIAAIGLCVASGDINGDGIDDLIVGASGKVIAYYGSKSKFNPTSGTPDAVFTGKDSGFGASIAVIQDVDGDGFRDIAVGASKAVVSGVSETGRLYILKGGAGSRSVNADVAFLARIDGELNSGQFGSAILPVKDADGCGKADVVVSAIHGDGDGRPMTGKIFFLSGRNLATTTSVATAKVIPGTARDMHLGYFLALVDEQWLAAGAPTEKNNTGTVRLFRLGFFGGNYSEQ